MYDKPAAKHGRSIQAGSLAIKSSEFHMIVSCRSLLLDNANAPPGQHALANTSANRRCDSDMEPFVPAAARGACPGRARGWTRRAPGR